MRMHPERAFLDFRWKSSNLAKLFRKILGPSRARPVNRKLTFIRGGRGGFGDRGGRGGGDRGGRGGFTPRGGRGGFGGDRGGRGGGRGGFGDRGGRGGGRGAPRGGRGAPRGGARGGRGGARGGAYVNQVLTPHSKSNEPTARLSLSPIATLVSSSPAERKIFLSPRT